MAILNYAKPDLNAYAQQIGAILQGVRNYPVIEVGLGSVPAGVFWLTDVILGEVAPTNGGTARNWHDLLITVPVFLARGKAGTNDFPAIRRAINDDIIDVYLAFLIRDDFKTATFPTMQRGFVPTSLRVQPASLRALSLDNVSYIGAEMNITFYHRIVAS